MNNVSDQVYDALDEIAKFTALRCLLIAVVKEHPEKAAILEYFQRMMTHMSESMRDRARPDVAQADPIFAQIAEGSPEVFAQLADSSAQFAEKLQEYAQRLLEDCQ
jgi:hypothetical protein